MLGISFSSKALRFWRSQKICSVWLYFENQICWTFRILFLEIYTFIRFYSLFWREYVFDNLFLVFLKLIYCQKSKGFENHQSWFLNFRQNIFCCTKRKRKNCMQTECFDWPGLECKLVIFIVQLILVDVTRGNLFNVVFLLLSFERFSCLVLRVWACSMLIWSITLLFLLLVFFPLSM